jgi:hypothetical protein
MKQIKTALCIFQANIGGKLAQAEVETDPTVLNSREGRKAAENMARIAFANLSPAWNRFQPIKCVEILIIDKTPADPDAGNGATK